MRTFKTYLTEEPHVDFGELDGNEVFIDFYSEKDPQWVTQIIDIYSGQEITDTLKNKFKIDESYEKEQITTKLIKNPFFIKSLKEGFKNLSDKDKRRFNFVVPQILKDKIA